MEQERLRLEAQQIRSQQPGRPDKDDQPVPVFDVRTNVRLEPAYNEKDPDTFFALKNSETLARLKCRFGHLLDSEVEFGGAY